MTSIIRDKNEVTIEKIRELITKVGKGKSICPYCGQERNINSYGIPQSLVEHLKERAKSTY